MDSVIAEVEWIPSARNPADGPSRLVDPTDWWTTDKVFHEIDQYFGGMTIDRMADGTNARLRRFNSRHWCRDCEEVNCFSVSWKGEKNYVCPPIGQIHRVLTHIEQTRAEFTVMVVPEWPAQPWWPQLIDMASVWLPIPLGAKAFAPGPSGCVEPWRHPAARWWAVLVSATKKTQSNA